jgi:hypothetical protein
MAETIPPARGRLSSTWKQKTATTVPTIVRRDAQKGGLRDRTDVPAAREMRDGPSGPDGRVRAQTTGSCFGPRAEVVSVLGKGGTEPVR